MDIEEEWRDIKDYEGLYQASNLGRIRSLNYGRTGEVRVLSPAKQRNGYLMVMLVKDGKRKGLNIQRIIANTFIPNDQNKSQVNHINGDKTDNRIDNLEWVTPKENTNKAYEIGLKKTGKYLYNTRWIYQFDLNMNFIKKWESMSQASRELNIKQGEISKCCAGKRKTAGNYIWLNDDGLLNELDKDNNIISDLQNEVTLKQCELDNKDKIINEMAKWIEKHTGYAIDETLYKESKEYIIDYFTKKVSEK